MRHQLEQLKHSTIATGQQWQKDTGVYGAGSDWPHVLEKSKALSALDMGDIMDEDDQLDFEALGLPMSDTLELDERHTQFLESEQREEEDEVERLVGRLDSTGNSDRVREAESSVAAMSTAAVLGNLNT